MLQLPEKKQQSSQRIAAQWFVVAKMPPRARNLQGFLSLNSQWVEPW